MFSSLTGDGLHQQTTFANIAGNKQAAGNKCADTTMADHNRHHHQQQQQQSSSSGLFGKWSSIFTLGMGSGNNNSSSSSSSKSDYVTSDNNNGQQQQQQQQRQQFTVVMEATNEADQHHRKHVTEQRLKLLQQQQDELIRCHQLQLEAMAMEHDQLIHQKEQLKQSLQAQSQVIQKVMQQQQTATSNYQDHQVGKPAISSAKVSRRNSAHVANFVQSSHFNQSTISQQYQQQQHQQHQQIAFSPSYLSCPPIVDIKTGMVIANSNAVSQQWRPQPPLGYSTNPHKKSPHKVSKNLSQADQHHQQQQHHFTTTTSSMFANQIIAATPLNAAGPAMGASQTIGRRQRKGFAEAAAFNDCLAGRGRPVKNQLSCPQNAPDYALLHNANSSNNQQYIADAPVVSGRRLGKVSASRTISANYNPHAAKPTSRARTGNNRSGNSGQNKQMSSRQHVEEIFSQAPTACYNQLSDYNDDSERDGTADDMTLTNRDYLRIVDSGAGVDCLNGSSMSEFSADSLKRSLLAAASSGTSSGASTGTTGTGTGTGATNKHGCAKQANNSANGASKRKPATVARQTPDTNNNHILTTSTTTTKCQSLLLATTANHRSQLCNNKSQIYHSCDSSSSSSSSISSRSHHHQLTITRSSIDVASLCPPGDYSTGATRTATNADSETITVTNEHQVLKLANRAGSQRALNQQQHQQHLQPPHYLTLAPHSRSSRANKKPASHRPAASGLSGAAPGSSPRVGRQPIVDRAPIVDRPPIVDRAPIVIRSGRKKTVTATVAGAGPMLPERSSVSSCASSSDHSSQSLSALGSKRGAGKSSATAQPSATTLLPRLPKPVPPPVVPLYREVELQSADDTETQKQNNGQSDIVNGDNYHGQRAYQSCKAGDHGDHGAMIGKQLRVCFASDDQPDIEPAHANNGRGDNNNNNNDNNRECCCCNGTNCKQQELPDCSQLDKSNSSKSALVSDTAKEPRKTSGILSYLKSQLLPNRLTGNNNNNNNNTIASNATICAVNICGDKVFDEDCPDTDNNTIIMTIAHLKQMPEPASAIYDVPSDNNLQYTGVSKAATSTTSTTTTTITTNKQRLRNYVPSQRAHLPSPPLPPVRKLIGSNDANKQPARQLKSALKSSSCDTSPSIDSKCQRQTEPQGLGQGCNGADDLPRDATSSGRTWSNDGNNNDNDSSNEDDDNNNSSSSSNDKSATATLASGSNRRTDKVVKICSVPEYCQDECLQRQEPHLRPNGANCQFAKLAPHRNSVELPFKNNKSRLATSDTISHASQVSTLKASSLSIVSHWRDCDQNDDDWFDDEQLAPMSFYLIDDTSNSKNKATKLAVENNKNSQQQTEQQKQQQQQKQPNNNKQNCPTNKRQIAATNCSLNDDAIAYAIAYDLIDTSHSSDNGSISASSTATTTTTTTSEREKKLHVNNNNSNNSGQLARSNGRPSDAEARAANLLSRAVKSEHASKLSGASCCDSAGLLSNCNGNERGPERRQNNSARNDSSDGSSTSDQYPSLLDDDVYERNKLLIDALKSLHKQMTEVSDEAECRKSSSNNDNSNSGNSNNDNSNSGNNNSNSGNNNSNNNNSGKAQSDAASERTLRELASTTTTDDDKTSKVARACERAIEEITASRESASAASGLVMPASYLITASPKEPNWTKSTGRQIANAHIDNNNPPIAAMSATSQQYCNKSQTTAVNSIQSVRQSNGKSPVGRSIRVKASSSEQQIQLDNRGQASQALLQQGQSVNFHCKQQTIYPVDSASDRSFSSSSSSSSLACHSDKLTALISKAEPGQLAAEGSHQSNSNSNNHNHKRLAASGQANQQRQSQSCAVIKDLIGSRPNDDSVNPATDRDKDTFGQDRSGAVMGQVNEHLSHSFSGSAPSHVDLTTDSANHSLNSSLNSCKNNRQLVNRLNNHHVEVNFEPIVDKSTNLVTKSVAYHEDNIASANKYKAITQTVLSTTSLLADATKTNSINLATRNSLARTKLSVIPSPKPETVNNEHTKVSVTSKTLSNNNKLVSRTNIEETMDIKDEMTQYNALNTISNMNNDSTASIGLDAMTSKNHKYLDSVDSELKSKRNSIRSNHVAPPSAEGNNNLDQMNITIVDKYTKYIERDGEIEKTTNTNEQQQMKNVCIVRAIEATNFKTCRGVSGKPNNIIEASILARQKLKNLRGAHNRSLDSNGDDVLEDEEEETACNELAGVVNAAYNVRFVDTPDQTATCPEETNPIEKTRIFSSSVKSSNVNDNGSIISVQGDNFHTGKVLIKSTSSNLASEVKSCLDDEGHHQTRSSHSFSCGSTSKRSGMSTKKYLVQSTNESDNGKLSNQFILSSHHKYRHQSSFNSNCSNGQATDDSSQIDEGPPSSSVSSRVSLSSSSFNDDENLGFYEDDDYDDLVNNSDELISARGNLSSSSSNNQQPLIELLMHSRANKCNMNKSSIHRDLNGSSSDMTSLSQSPSPSIQASSSKFAYKISISTAKIDQESNQLKISQPKIITSGGELLSSTKYDRLNVSSPIVLASATPEKSNCIQQTVTASPMITTSGLNLSLNNSDNSPMPGAITAISIGSPINTETSLLPIQPELAAAIVEHSTNTKVATAPGVPFNTVSPLPNENTDSTTSNQPYIDEVTTSILPIAQLTCRLDVGDTIKISSTVLDVSNTSATTELPKLANIEQESCKNFVCNNNKIILDVPGDKYPLVDRSDELDPVHGCLADDNVYGYSTISSISINNVANSEYSTAFPMCRHISRTNLVDSKNSVRGGATLMIDDHIYEDLFEYQRISSSSPLGNDFTSLPDNEEKSSYESQSKFIIDPTAPLNVFEFESPKKSIFEGASKDEILEYLEDARERVPEVLMAADDVMMIGNGELIVVNQLDPGSPATPISIVEPSEVNHINQECLPMEKPHMNWQQRIYSHKNRFNQRLQPQTQAMVSNDNGIDLAEVLNELPNENQAHSQNTKVESKNEGLTRALLPPLPPPRVSSMTGKYHCSSTQNDRYQEEYQSTATDRSETSSGMKLSPIDLSSKQDNNSKLSIIKLCPTNDAQNLTNHSANRRYRTSNVSNSSTESATTTGTNSSSGASMDTDDSVDLENYYFNNKLNLLEPTLAVMEALRSSETSGNSSAASTLYDTSLLSCSSSILKANLRDNSTRHAALPVVPMNTNLRNSLTILDNQKDSTSKFDIIDGQSNQSIVAFESIAATPTKEIKDKSKSTDDRESMTTAESGIIGPVISDIKLKEVSNVDQKSVELPRQIKTSCINSVNNYRQRTMPTTSIINHRNHRRVFSSCDSSIEHQCADCDQFIDIDHSVVISGALKLQKQRLEQFGDITNDDIDQQSNLLNSYLLVTPIVCKSCEKKRVERKEIISEFVDTELKYGRDLKIIHDEFFTPMQIAGLLSKDQINGIFLNLQELMLVHSRFAEKLKDSVNYANENGDIDYTTVNIGELFLKSAEMLHAFESYCVRQGTAACLLARLAKEKELLRIFLRVSQMENTLLRRMNLAAFLMVPVQRVTKYPLLLNRLYKVTAYHHKDREALRDAQLKVELHLEHINQQTKGVGATTKIWRRISNLSAASNRRLTNAEDIGHIKIRKAAIDLLKWERDETQFVHSGKLHFSQITEFVSKQRSGSRPLRYLTAHALLVVCGKPNHKYRPDLVTSSIDHKLMFTCSNNGIEEAALLLMREKNGRFIPCREALFLSNCVLSNDCSTFNDTCQALSSSQSTMNTSSPVPMISANNQTSIKLTNVSSSQIQESAPKSPCEFNTSDNMGKSNSAVKTNTTILNQLIRSSKSNQQHSSTSMNMDSGSNSKTQQAICQSSSAISSSTPKAKFGAHKQLSPNSSNFNASNGLSINGLSNGNQNHLHHLNHHHQPYGDYQESFELHERLTKESILFKADTPLKTRYWLQLLRYHAKDLGQWRRRRNGLANIMMMRQDN